MLRPAAVFPPSAARDLWLRESGVLPRGPAQPASFVGRNFLCLRKSISVFLLLIATTVFFWGGEGKKWKNHISTPTQVLYKRKHQHQPGKEKNTTPPPHISYYFSYDFQDDFESS